MKKISIFAALLLLLASCGVKEKEIYVPKDLQGMDLNDPESEYCYERTALTENFVIFWEKGFGNDLSAAPELEGQDMTIDLENLKEKLETFYDYFLLNNMLGEFQEMVFPEILILSLYSTVLIGFIVITVSFLFTLN